MAKNTSMLSSKVILLGVLLIILLYLFHPVTGNMHMTINGEQVTGPLAELAAFPMSLGILVFSGLLAALIFLGAGTLFLVMMAIIGFTALFVFMPFLAPFIIVGLLVYAIIELFR